MAWIWDASLHGKLRLHYVVFQNVIPVQAVKPIQPQPDSKVTVEFADDSNPDHSTGLMSPEVRMQGFYWPA